MITSGVTTPAAPCTGSVVGTLLGPAIEALPPAVRAMHAVTHDTRCEGMVEVRQARTRLGRLAGRLMHLPRSVGRTHVSLSIGRPAVAEGQRPIERWCRSFGGELMVSKQTTDGACLIERVGRLELSFEVRVADERLHFRQVRTGVNVGPRRPPIPRWLAPTVVASVGAGLSGEGVDVSVLIAAPGLGVLLSYAGVLTAVDVP